MSDTTTDLSIVRKQPEIHTIGAITVVETTPVSGGGREYHVYLDDKDLGHYTWTLYSAVIFGIAAKMGEPLAAKYACKLLGL